MDKIHSWIDTLRVLVALSATLALALALSGPMEAAGKKLALGR